MNERRQPAPVEVARIPLLRPGRPIPRIRSSVMTNAPVTRSPEDGIGLGRARMPQQPCCKRPVRRTWLDLPLWSSYSPKISPPRSHVPGVEHCKPFRLDPVACSSDSSAPWMRAVALVAIGRGRLRPDPSNAALEIVRPPCQLPALRTEGLRWIQVAPRRIVNLRGTNAARLLRQCIHQLLFGQTWVRSFSPLI